MRTYYHYKRHAAVLQVTELRSVSVTVTRGSKRPPCVVRCCRCGLCRWWWWWWRWWRYRWPRSDVENGVGRWRTGWVDVVECKAICAVSAGTIEWRLVTGTRRRSRRTCRQHHLIVWLYSSTYPLYSYLLDAKYTTNLTRRRKKSKHVIRT